MGNGAGAVAGEEGQDYAANLGNRQQSDGNFRGHWHIQANGVAFAQPQTAQGVGAAVDLGPQVSIAHDAGLTFFPFPTQSHAILHRRTYPLVQTVVDDVHFAVHAPFGPLDAIRQVNYLAVRLIELNVQFPENCIPKPFDVGG